MIKFIQAGSIIEIYNYSVSMKSEGGRREKLSSLYEEKNYKQRAVHRREKVRRLACANFKSSRCTFVTLTFDDKKVAHDIRDVSACDNEVIKFIKRLKYYLHLDDLKYLGVVEFQDKNGRGAVHYHMLLNIPFIDCLKLESIWGLGFVFIESVENVDNLGAYLVKYMTKENADPRLKNKKGYLASHNLDKPHEQSFFNIADYKNFVNDVVKKNGLDKLKPVYENTYDTDILGTCKYSQYNLDRQN